MAQISAFIRFLEQGGNRLRQGLDHLLEEKPRFADPALLKGNLTEIKADRPFQFLGFVRFENDWRVLMTGRSGNTKSEGDRYFDLMALRKNEVEELYRKTWGELKSANDIVQANVIGSVSARVDAFMSEKRLQGLAEVQAQWGKFSALELDKHYRNSGAAGAAEEYLLKPLPSHFLRPKADVASRAVWNPSYLPGG